MLENFYKYYLGYHIFWDKEIKKYYVYLYLDELPKYYKTLKQCEHDIFDNKKSKIVASRTPTHIRILN